MFRKVAFTMYPVIDLDRARNFYENILGLPASNAAYGIPWVEYDLPGGGCLGITTVTGNKPSADSGGTIAFEVEDLDALCADLEAKGVTFKTDLIHSPVCRMRVIEDSEGNGVLLHQLKNRT
ncbi:putative enzyme related to lactoylglutathione lyase [Sphingomonas kyeonggiensis]|uniref:Putative enzyme related to lactoylglutathione lyase n=1 Tax=Sphingomonas kyeonggiensis TaxID=1268553 RepID=A0A7W7K4A3_9SPHN|nr:VOC family protein [Sphingomonas kyeonggiensis]MBB4840743.1 putative enzyme related to lactoylglutathione lyase [Sphingomonas kyeonggiensis]